MPKFYGYVNPKDVSLDASKVLKYLNKNKIYPRSVICDNAKKGVLIEFIDVLSDDSKKKLDEVMERFFNEQ